MLVDLVDDAVKYSPDRSDVHVVVMANHGVGGIEVRDKGLGIPSGSEERIFEKFVRLDPDQRRGMGGTGMGLYICRELVERMDGRIRVESNGSTGSRFLLELPLAAA